MQIYDVNYSKSVVDKIGDLFDYIAAINTEASANRYIDDLIDEIDTLSYRADTIPQLIYTTAHARNISTKRLLVKKGIISVFFHITHNCVFVDDIIPSKLVYQVIGFTP